MTERKPTNIAPPAPAGVEEFLAKVRAMPPVARSGAKGRLIFAMDATMSRQPTWDRALAIQAGMFAEAGKVGGLDIQLVYFRGLNECRASKWVSNAEGLARLMTGIECHGGYTQIGRVLAHVKREAAIAPVNAVAYVGDAMEEHVDALCQAAGEIGLIGVPLFLFQEGSDMAVEGCFREMARLTRGAHFRFDLSAGRTLHDLLAAVAVYAAGGQAALEDLARTRGGTAVKLLAQMR